MKRIMLIALILLVFVAFSIPAWPAVKTPDSDVSTAVTSFENFDQKANQLFDILSSVLSNVRTVR